jgi:hypothetical protein
VLEQSRYLFPGDDHGEFEISRRIQLDRKELSANRSRVILVALEPSARNSIRNFNNEKRPGGRAVLINQEL